MSGRRDHPDFYVMFNAHWEAQRFTLPSHDGRLNWRRLVDTNLPSPHDIVEEKDAVLLSPGGPLHAGAAFDGDFD